MSLLLSEAFDDGLYSYRGSGQGTPNTLYGKDGTKGVRLGDNTNTHLQIDGGTNYPAQSNDTTIFGFWHYTQGNVTNNGIFVRFRDAGTGGGLHLDVRINIDGSLDFICGSGTFSTAAGAVPHQQWCFIEMKVKVNATTGTIDCWVDGSSVLSETGKDTYASGDAFINFIDVGGSSGSFLQDHYMDSFYLLNAAGSAPWNDKLGVVRIHQDLPTGNGNSSVLVGSDSNSTDNYQQVDDDPVVTTTYNGSATQGDKDTYAFGSLPSTASSILGVVITTLTEKTDVGAKFGRIVNRSNATDYPGTTYALSQGYSLDSELFETDPDTALAWTESGYNAAEHGWEVRDS